MMFELGRHGMSCGLLARSCPELRYFQREGKSVPVTSYLLNAEGWLFLNIAFPIDSKSLLGVAFRSLHSIFRTVSVLMQCRCTIYQTLCDILSMFDTPPVLSSFALLPLFSFRSYPFQRYFYFSLFYRSPLFPAVETDRKTWSSLLFYFPPPPSHPHSNLATVYSCIDPIHPLYQPCRSSPSSEAVAAATGMRGEKMLTHCPAMIGNVEHTRYVLRRKSS